MNISIKDSKKILNSTYKSPIAHSSISLINTNEINKKDHLINKFSVPLENKTNVAQAFSSNLYKYSSKYQSQIVANTSLISRVSTNTSHNSLSSTNNKYKIKRTESKIREHFFEDPRYKSNKLKKLRKQDIQKRFNELHHNHNKSHEHKHNLDDEYKVAQCRLTFIFDPNGRLSYWMGFIVSLAFLYNFWVIIYRYSFNEINSKNRLYWFALDYFADFLYICDILFNFRTGFLEEGVLQTDPIRLRHHYMNTTRFYVDCLCLLPLDILYLSIGYNSILRCFRLVKIYRFWSFLDRTERHTNFPNVFRTIVMLHYLFAIFHWNACISYFLSRFLSDDLMLKNHNLHLSSSSNLLTYNEYSSKNILIDENQVKFKFKSSSEQILNDGEILKEYLKAFYLSTKIMTMVNEIPNPRTSRDYLFSIFQLISALLLFATIMGHVGYIVSNLGNARKEFQSKLDAVKTYMSLRRVPERLQDRVIRWFDFLWTNHKSIDDNHVLGLLPYKLRAEIAIHVHLDTLKRVEIFQNTEAGFLNELVLRLKPVLYSPGDFICRKGEVGKEMYIVNGGKLQVISDNGKIVLATLKAGSYFGEISILNMGASGNRRTASVKSVGYSDLFCLSKEDLWEVLKEYPAVRVKLEAIAVRRLENHKKPLSEIVNMSRCKSAPGLMEPSQAETPIKVVRRYGTLPTSLLKRTDISYFISPDNNKSIRKKIKKSTQSTMKVEPSQSSEQRQNDDNQINEELEKIRFESLEKENALLNNVDQSTSNSISFNSFNSNILNTSICNNNNNNNNNNNDSNNNCHPSFDDYRLLNKKLDNLILKANNIEMLKDQSYILYLLQEMERIKKVIIYLESENSTLYFKLNKQIQNLNNCRLMNENEVCLKPIKAKQDTDSDEFKV